MTLQEIFNQAAEGMMRQGVPSGTVCGYSGGKFACRYTHKQGDTLLHCGVGFLLDPAFEDDESHETGSMGNIYGALFDSEDGELTVGNINSSDDALIAALAQSGINTADEPTMRLLVQLQECHDGVANIAERDNPEKVRPVWYHHLRCIADSFRLALPECLRDGLYQ